MQLSAIPIRGADLGPSLKSLLQFFRTCADSCRPARASASQRRPARASADQREPARTSAICANQCRPAPTRTDQREPVPTCVGQCGGVTVILQGHCGLALPYRSYPRRSSCMICRPSPIGLLFPEAAYQGSAFSYRIRKGPRTSPMPTQAIFDPRPFRRCNAARTLPSSGHPSS